MPSGNAFTEGQIEDIGRVVAGASRESGLRFSVYVGEPEGDCRAFADTLHAALGPDAPNAVLIFVAPGARRLEIVTGRDARQRLPDRACGLAALSMTSALAVGDLVRAVTTGVQMLAEAAGRVPLEAR